MSPTWLNIAPVTVIDFLHRLSATTPQHTRNHYHLQTSIEISFKLHNLRKRGCIMFVGKRLSEVGRQHKH